MKHIITIVLLFFGLSAYSAPRDCIILHFMDGSYVVVPLEGNPKITFDGNIVQIDNERYQFTNVRKYTIADSENSGIIDIRDGNSGRVSFDKDQMVVRLNSPSQTVRLHSAVGVEIPIDTKPDVNGVLRIPIPQSPNQVYLLTIGNETIKIRKP